MSKQISKVLEKFQIGPTVMGSSTGLEWLEDAHAEPIESYSPVDGKLISQVGGASKMVFDKIVELSRAAFKKWRSLPAPKRGEIIRQIGLSLREHKEDLGLLVTYEMGKPYQEGLGEVQEMIDICDFAVGLSRQLYGLNIASERPDHRMMEQWHPLGPVAIITAFNFPVAVYSWNAFIAAVCGDTIIWKPSEKTPLCSIAVQKIIGEVLKKNDVPEGVFCLINGDYKIGELITSDHRIPLVSATGSVRMGKIVGPAVAKRLGRTILELGGNNAIIVTENADLNLAIRAVLFGAVGTSGQRCTSTRRLIVHEKIFDKVKRSLVEAYKQVKAGNPMDEGVHMGPLIDQQAVKKYFEAIENVKDQGGEMIIEGQILAMESECYVTPSIAEVPVNLPMLCEETFAPLLYLIKYKNLEEAIQIHNDVPQGLSSAIFSNDIREVETFLSSKGSDCGIANVNIGTSGAEIGGAFGGEKDTGGGREAGSDSWKAYMRRQTNTINYGSSLPLAQGIEFPI